MHLVKKKMFKQSAIRLSGTIRYNIDQNTTNIFDSRPSNLQYQAYVPVILFCWLLLIVLSDILSIYKSVLY